MSSHNRHQPGWPDYRQNQGNNDQQDGSQNHNNSSQGTNAGTQTQGSMYGSSISPSYMSPDQVTTSTGVGNGLNYAHSPYPANSYQGGSPDMQYMMQMMINLRNELGQLNQLIAQNNQLLQSMHDQEDTKCVQGSGGGAVIVRM